MAEPIMKISIFQTLFHCRSLFKEKKFYWSPEWIMLFLNIQKLIYKLD